MRVEEESGREQVEDCGEMAEEGSVAEPGADEGPGMPEELPPLRPVLEAALFASAEPVPLARLVRTLGGWSRSQVAAALGDLAAHYEDSASGIRLVETGGGFQLRSADAYAPWVRRFFAERPPRLSRAVLETLAIVAYRQPATRGEIESIRGVNCDAVLGALVARGLIQVLGRRESPGRPVEYGTTREFLELFSLRDLADLPPLPDPVALATLIGSEDRQDESEPGETAPGERAVAEGSEPGGDRLTAGGGGPDPRGSGTSEREGDPGAGREGGPAPGSDHG